jgi:ankyrin repeat protein
MDPVLEAAARSGDEAQVAKLIAFGIDVNGRDRYGQTALMLAAQRGHAAVVDALIAAGADLNVAAKYSLTAMMLAVINDHGAIAIRLADAGADRNKRGGGAPGFSGRTAADLARGRGDAALAARLEPAEDQGNANSG